MKPLVVIPTYNERENIEILVRRLHQMDLGIEILIVDDNSPDGTGELVDSLCQQFREVHVIHRDKKAGIGPAYIAGFKWALARDYDVMIEMDADLSHRPRYLRVFLEQIQKYDMVFGSRWIRGGRISNWSWQRVLLSWLANIYGAWVLGVSFRDLTGGFNCYRREVLENLHLDSIHSDGYSFQIEMKYKTYKNGFRVLEVPITFTDRKAGTSKISKRIVWEALFLVWKLRFSVRESAKKTTYETAVAAK